MSQLTEVTGMILSASPIGEYDRRVVILTKEKGKLSAFAKGARRPTSHLAGATAPCTFGTFHIYEGRTSNTLQSAEVSNYFSELRMDLEAAYYAFYFLEFADYYARESNDERELLKLLYQTMRILTKKTIPLPLVRYIFELKIVTINGEGPQVFQCMECGDKERPCYFSVRRGGLICEECRQGAIDAVRLHTSTLYAMQYIVSSSIEKLYTFNLSDEVREELGRLMERYLDVYVDKKFKSLEVLEQINLQNI